MQGEKSPRDDSDDEPLIGPDAKMRRLLKDKKLRFSTGEDYLEEEVAGMSQQESQDLNAEAVDEAEARLGKDASNANTQIEDSDDDEPIFGPEADMRRLLNDQEDVVRQAAAKTNNRFKGKSTLKITTCDTSSLRLN
jgi:hypothetical protein